MAEVVVATLNVSFSEDATGTSGVLKLEIDDREDGGNGGDTSFSPGDEPVFFMFKGDNVNLITTTPRTTSGGVTSFPPGNVLKDIDENITFSNSSTASLGYPPEGSVTKVWLGGAYSLSGTSLTGPSSTPIPDHDDNGNLTVPGGKNMIGLLHCTYKSRGSLWQLKSVATDIDEVLLLAVGTVV